MNKSVVLSLSGGMDSATLLLNYLARGFLIESVSFNYGQRHNKEISQALYLVAFLNSVRFPGPNNWRRINHKVIDISGVRKLLVGSALTSSQVDVPLGHYEEPTMKMTVVPNRNCIFLSLLAAYAISKGSAVLAFGAHSGDHAIYPDCREEFVRAMQNVVSVGNYSSPQIEAPFLRFNKGEILSEGLRLCSELRISPAEFYSRTWTCYNGRDKACGKCGSCTERLEAFQFCGMKDPLEYE